MTIFKRHAILLAGVAATVSCAPLTQPKTDPQPQAKIIATSDATYMQPVGASNEHMVPEPPPKTPFDDFVPHANAASGTSSSSSADADRVAALESRVARLERKVDVLSGDHPVRADVPAKDVVPSGVAAPPPGSVQPVPLGAAAATAAPVSLAAADHVKKAMVPVRHAAASGRISGLRIGEHPGVTRLVLDCGERHVFHADIDNDEHILTVQVEGAAWTDGKEEHHVAKSPLVSSWQAAPDGKGGTRFVVQLRGNAKLATDHFLPPTSGVAGARLVIDLAAG